MEKKNVVIQKFRDVLMKHYNRTVDVMDKVDAIRADIEAKRGTAMQYTASQSSAMVREAIRPLEDELPGMVKQIDNLMDAVRNALAKKYELRGEEVSPDLQLLTGAFDLSSEKLKELNQRHRDNPTMSTAIKTYANKHGISPVGFSFRDQASEEQVYNSMAGQARHWMGRMTSGIEEPAARAMLSFANNFGTTMAPEQTEIIGDGAGLLQ